MSCYSWFLHSLSTLLLGRCSQQKINENRYNTDMKKIAYFSIVLIFVLILVACISLCSNILSGNSSATVPYTVQTYEVKTVFNGVIDLIHTDKYISSTKEEKINLICEYLDATYSHQEKSSEFVSKIVPDSIVVTGDSIGYGEESIYVVFKVDDTKTEYFWYHNKEEFDSKQEPFSHSVVK